MADFQRVVEEIRFFLQGSDQTLREELRDYATSYAEAAREANDRLRRCKEYLNQNLRSEAIHVAEAAPNLLDMVAVLDFPELPEWEEFCADHALTPPPKLLLLVAEDLNAAYAVEQPLKEHLKKLRYLALVQAPLDERLAVMRELAELDPESHFWKEDIAVFETARLRELEDVARDAASRGDADALKRLVLELQSDKWVQPPSAELVTRVKRAYVKVTRSSGRDRVTQLLPALQEAVAAEDLDRARRVRNDWELAVREARLEPDDALLRSAQPALHWIAEHDQRAAAEAAFQTAVSDLRDEINRGDRASINALERLHHDARSHGRPLPDELEDRYGATLSSLRASQAWNRKLFVAGIGGGVLVVAGLMAFFVVSGLRGGAVQAAVERMETLLDESDLESALKFRDQLAADQPEVLAAATMTPLLARLEKLGGEEESRSAQVARHLKAAAALVDRRVLDEATRELDAAAKLARTSSEQSDVDDLRLEIKLARSDNTRQNEEAVQTAAVKAQAKLDSAVRELEANRLADAATTLDEVESILNTAREKAASVSEPVQNQFKEADAGFARLQQRLQETREANVLENSIAAAVEAAARQPSAEGVEKVRERLREFADRFPESPQAAVFRRAADEAAAAQGFLAWSALRSSWGGDEEFIFLKDVEAGNRSKALSDLLKSHGSVPGSAALRSYAAYLDALGKRGGVCTDLEKQFQSELLRNVWQIRQGDKRWYAKSDKVADQSATIQSKLEQGAGSIRFRYIYAHDGRDKETQITVTGNPTTIAPAPQTVLAEKVTQALKEARYARDWERSMLDILETIRTDSATDALFRLVLLETVLQKATTASTLFSEVVRAQQETLRAAKIDRFATWMDPDSSAADDHRRRAQALLEKNLTSFQKATDRLDAARQTLVRPLLDRRTLAGWLVADADGKINCNILGSQLAGADGRLCVLALIGGRGSGTWKDIGSLEGGKAELDGTDEATAGRLVFVQSADR